MIFLSATLDEEDIYDLGLEGRRVLLLDSGTPIPKEARPVVYDPVGSMSFANRDRTLPHLVDKLAQLLHRHKGRKGLVHTTYELASKLRDTEFGKSSRVKFHSPESRGLAYYQWTRASDDSVLVGCAMHEGLDLADDLCRWQVATKINYPSMADPAIRAKAMSRPRWYQWEAAKHIQQLVGRNSRHAGDYGLTYILDSDFGRLYSRNRDLFSPSFHEQLTGATYDFDSGN